MANTKLLLECPIKLTQQTDVGAGLLQFIQSYHQDHCSHPDQLNPDIHLIQSYRRGLPTTNTTDSNHTGSSSNLNDLIRYHAHLAYLSNKFPPDIGVEFSYTPIFSTSSRKSSGLIIPGELPSKSAIKMRNLGYERASVLFDVAAMMMNIAIDAPSSVSNTDQLKRSISHLQQASGCFALLRDTVVKHIQLPPDSPDPPSPDLSFSCLSALENLALSQAQECVWLQAVKDQKSNGTISRIAQETSRLYQLTLDFMKDSAKVDIHWIGFAFPDDWIKFVQLKVAHFLAVAQFRKGLDDSAARELKVGRLEYASTVLKAALSTNKPSGGSETTKNVFQEAKNVHLKLHKSLEQARRDNDLIYLKHVPSETELPVIKPVSLVKPTVPQQISDPLPFLTDAQFGHRLFENVLPYHIYRVKGLYEDRKKDHVKSVIENVAEQYNLEVVNALRSMNLPGSLEALERPISLPPSLIRNSNELRRRNAPQMLINKLTSVEQASQANTQLLTQITMALNKEQEEDGRLRTQFGTQLWSRPASNLVNKALRQSEAQLLNTLDAATSSDRMVKEKYLDWRSTIELLCQDEDTIRKAIPPLSGTGPTPELDSIPQTGEGEFWRSPRQLRRLLDNLEDLREARKAIVNAALYFSSRDFIDQSVLEKFNTMETDQPLDTWIEFLLDHALLSYNKFEIQIKENHQKQIELIVQIQNVNEEFIKSRKDDPVAKNREKVIQELDVGYHEFDAIMKNLDEGFRFHSEFYKYLTLLKSQVEEYIQERDKEAETTEERINEQLARTKIDQINLNHTDDDTTNVPRQSSKPNDHHGHHIRKNNDHHKHQITNHQTPDLDHHQHHHHRVQNENSNASNSKSQTPRKSIVPGTYNPKLHGPPVFLDS